MNKDSTQQIPLRRVALAAVSGALVADPILALAIAPVPLLALAAGGLVKGETEEIVFAGQVVIKAAIVDDTVFRRASLLQLVIDFTGLSGTGAVTGQKYATSARIVLLRPLLSADPIVVEFHYVSDADPQPAHAASARLAVSPARMEISGPSSAVFV